VQGVFPPGVDGTHVNGVDRNPEKSLIVTGDDWGMVNLYRYPCLEGAKNKAFRAHSSHVVRTRFNAKGDYVYSVGGYDSTLMIWKVKS
jgi:WD40 repeat protein